MTDLRQTREWAKFLSLSGWTVVGHNPYEFYKKILFFYIRKVQRTDTLPQATLPFTVTFFEPLTITPPLRRASPYLPTATLRINLSRPFQFSTNVRRILRQKVNITSISPDIFYQNYHRYCQFRTLTHTIFNHLIKAFGPKCHLITATHDNLPVAGIILLCSKDTSFYYQAWTSPLGRKLGAQYHLVSHALKLSQKLKLQYFDFDGIDDHRFPHKSWEGFTRFKKKFGGEIIAFPGCFIKWF